MKTAIAIRHVHFEDLGTLEPLLRERGYAVRHLDAATDELAALDTQSPDLLAILGGPIGAYDEAAYPFLEAELQLVRRRLDARRPLLGICLGAQLIARALGARVYPLGLKEIGFGTLELSAEGRSSVLSALAGVPVLHWHGDQFDIPPGATRLAGTTVGMNQAFSFGAHVLGLQFHLEVDMSRIEPWLVGHACELGAAGVDPRVLRMQAQEARAPLAAASRAVFSAWLDGADQRPMAAPSGPGASSVVRATHED